jgi:hypothetical protein
MFVILRLTVAPKTYERVMFIEFTTFDENYKLTNQQINRILGIIACIIPETLHYNILH